MRALGVRRRGLIPAHAGKTRAGSFCPGLLAAHPRSRGENPKTRSDRLLDPGSSPLTRGKLKQLQALHDLPRLIPAHAGKTTRQQRPFLTGWAHPRSRGENGQITSTQLRSAGSSPLTRGKREGEHRVRRRRRLIPAHAGKTPEARCPTTRIRAHPRSRGENSHPDKEASVKTGSSPLTRGKLSASMPTATRRRLIPAHAGKTLAGAFNPVSLIGSSPLTRGKRNDPVGSSVRGGLIPAHAGKTGPRLPLRWPDRAHPRSRGENVRGPQG